MAQYGVKIYTVNAGRKIRYFQLSMQLYEIYFVWWKKSKMESVSNA